MKKYLSTTKANYRPIWRKKRRIWAVVSVFLIGFGLLFPWLFSQISATVVYPFHAVTSWVKNSDSVIPVYFRSRSELLTQLEDMEMQASTKSGTQLSIEKLKAENEKLRMMVDSTALNDRLVAKVIASPNSMVYDMLQINRGYDDGVVVGAPVYSGLDSVVGLVVHTTKKYSFVELFTSPGFKSTAYVVGPNVFSTLEGVGGGVARVHLPQGIDIKPGQLVLLPGIFDGVYGEVVSVENHPTQPEQYGYVTPPIALNSLYFVSVEKNPLQPKEAEIIKNNVRDVVRGKAELDKEIFTEIDFELIDLEDNASTSATSTVSTTTTQN